MPDKVRLKLVKVRTYVNKNGLKVKHGEIVEVSKEEAERLLKTGYFEEVGEEKKAKK